MLLIRRYTEADHDAVSALHVLALKQVGAYMGSGPWDRDMDNVEGAYLNNRGEFLVGEYEGQVVAMGAFRRTDESSAEIKRMRVHPGFQRRGFGQDILMRLEARAAELGYTRLHLETAVQQTAAQKLYTRNGFRETHRGVLGGFDCIFYEKTIG